MHIEASSPSFNNIPKAVSPRRERIKRHPTLRDRILASKMGVYAVNLLEKGYSNQIVSIRNNKIVNDDIDVALAMPRVFDEELWAMNDILSI